MLYDSIVCYDEVISYYIMESYVLHHRPGHVAPVHAAREAHKQRQGSQRHIAGLRREILGDEVLLRMRLFGTSCCFLLFPGPPPRNSRRGVMLMPKKLCLCHRPILAA